MPHAPDLTGFALDGRYELHSLIGEGTFGRVYRGRDRRLARPVAVKVIKPWWAEDPEWVRCFEREAQLLASISDPGIVQIFDVGSAREGLYYVAEVVDGESLVSHLRDGPLAAAEALDIAEQLAWGLATAHAQQVVHRDIKPANVLISRDGRVKVTDFGVARLAAGSSDAVGGTIAGTPRYMAPEQARGLPTTPATDVYGVGVVLYEMLSGEPPFDGSSAVELAFSHVHDQPPPLPTSVDPELQRIVGRALSKDPSERYSDGAEMAVALAAVRAHASEERDLAHEAPRRHRPGAVAMLDRAAVRAGPDPQPAARDHAPAPSSSAPPREPVPATRVAVPYSPRRNVNPAGRRRRIALLAFVVLLGVGMVAGTIALAPGHARVPELRGLSRARAGALLRHDSLRAAFSHRYSAARQESVIAQDPVRGTRVTDGTTVLVTLSAGPAPVTVPQLIGSSSADAQAQLGRLKLQARVSEVPAPGVPTARVTMQSPGAGKHLLPQSTVSLSVAQAPRWRGLTSFAGEAPESSVPFSIRGSSWRMVYSMGYQGSCTLIFICSGPSATVTNVNTGATVQRFDLDEGTGRIWTFKYGPGVYRISIAPGSDTARWAVRVQDYY